MIHDIPNLNNTYNSPSNISKATSTAFGPRINIVPIKLDCNSIVNKLNTLSIDFQLNNLTYKEKVEIISNINNSFGFTSELESKKSKRTENNKTINNILTTRTQVCKKSKSKEKTYCCWQINYKQIKEERNKSYLSTNATKRSNFSAKSLQLNDSLTKKRKQMKTSCEFGCTIY